MASQDDSRTRNGVTNDHNSHHHQDDLTLEEIKSRDKANLKQMRTIFNQNFKPSTPKKHHSKTAVLLLRWDKPDLKKLQDEVHRLATVFRDKYKYDVLEASLLSAEYPSPQYQLAEILINFLNCYSGPDTLYIIYYAGHGWTEDNPYKFYLGQSTAQEELEKDSNKLVWNEAEKSLHGRQADILLIFDCCYAGALHQSRGVHCFEFLSACNENQIAVPPGETSFTSALIVALSELAEEKPEGFSTADLRDRICQHPKLLTNQQTPTLFHRDQRSAAHVWISPRQDLSITSSSNTGSSNLSPIPTSMVEWLEFRLTFDRAQKEDDIKRLSHSFTKFVAQHTSLELRQVELQDKSPHPRLQEKKLRHWVDRLMYGTQRHRESKISVGDDPDIREALGQSVLDTARKIIKDHTFDPQVDVTLDLMSDTLALSPNTTVHSEVESEGIRGAKRGLDSADPLPNHDDKRQRKTESGD